jgi:hypothetical protein
MSILGILGYCVYCRAKYKDEKPICNCLKEMDDYKKDLIKISRLTKSPIYKYVKRIYFNKARRIIEELTNDFCSLFCSGNSCTYNAEGRHQRYMNNYLMDNNSSIALCPTKYPEKPFNRFVEHLTFAEMRVNFYEYNKFDNYYDKHIVFLRYLSDRTIVSFMSQIMINRLIRFFEEIKVRSFDFYLYENSRFYDPAPIGVLFYYKDMKFCLLVASIDMENVLEDEVFLSLQRTLSIINP